jgi:geranylgeranyl diphosphate synthase type 3
VKLKKYCIALLEIFGFLSYIRHTFEELDTETRTGVAKHGGKPMLEDILDKMLEWKKWTEGNKPEK